MDNGSLRVLIVEDNPADVRLVKELLTETGTIDCRLQSASRLSEAQECLSTGDFNLVLLDLGLPDSRGLETFERLKLQIPKVPIIILTGLSDESIALEAVKMGAQDYIMKQELDGRLLARAMKYAVERWQSEEALYQERFKLAEYFENLPLLAYNIGLDDTIQDCNQRALKVLGYENKGELLGKPLITTLYAPDSRRKAIELFNKWKRIGKLQNEELQVITRDGQVLDILLNTDTIYDSDGKPLYGISTHLDITERKRMETEMYQSEEKFSKIFYSCPYPIMITTIKEGRYIDVNDSFLRITGYSREEVIGHTTLELNVHINPEQRSEILNAVREGKPVRNLEINRRIKSGEIRTWLHSVEVININNQQYLMTVVEDITERKAAEKALRESEENWRSLTENSADHVMLLDKDLNIKFINRAVPDIDKEEVIGKSIYEFTPAALHQETADCFERVLANKKPDIYSTEYLTKAGETRYFDVRVSPIIHNGAVAAFISSSNDVTEHWRMVERLRQSEARYSTLVEKGNDGIIILQDELLIFANAKMLDLSGYRTEEVIGEPFLDFCAPEYRELVIDRYKRRLSGEKIVNNYEIELLDKNGNKLPVEVNASIIDYEGKPADMAIIRDITERRQAEGALRASEEKSRAIFETAIDGILVADAETKKFSECNQAICRMTGYSAEELKNLGVRDIHPKEYGPIIIKKFEDQAMGIYSLIMDIPVKRKDGSIFYADINSAPVSFGEKTYLMGMFRDATERRQAEDSLRASEEKFSKAFYSCPYSMIITTIKDGRYVDVNDNFSLITGYSREEIIGHSVYEFNTYFDPEQRSNILQAIREGKQVRNIEIKRSTKSGEVRIGLHSVEPITVNGEQCLMTVVEDITERKWVEEALRVSEEKFSKAFQSNPNPLVISTLKDGRYIEVNDSFLQSSGYDREEVIGQTASELGIYVNPKQRSEIVKAIRRGEKIYSAEVELYSKSGERRIWLESVEPIAIGGEECIIRVIQDITERKQAVESLTVSEEKFSKAFYSSPNPLIISSLKEGRHIDVNDSFTNALGYSREEVIGHPVSEFNMYNNIEQRSKLARAIQKGKKVRNEEIELRTKTGEVRTWLLSMELITLNDEQCVITMVNDITERKQAEEMFRNLAINTPTGVYIAQNGKFVYVNRQFQKDTGYDENELLGMESLSIVVPEHREIVREKAINMLKRREINPYEYKVITKSGDIRWASEVVSSIQYNGKVAAIGSYQDVTDRKNMQEQLILTDRLASIGELASGIAHELNNPLTGVIGLSELLLKEDVSDGVREDIRLVYNEAQRAAQVVRNLLTFARKHPASRQSVNINDIIIKVIDLRAYEERVNNIQVITNFDSNLPEITADYFQLQQVFLNIAINAEYYMIEKHHRGTLTITTERQVNMVKASFADDGPGIARENLQHIFDPFFTTKEVGKGTGLGLSICHGIITAHGGNIYAESEPGEGATFIAELPIERPD
ncbi:PAS domain S-box protein [Chloroflexota bacterium]